VDVALKRLSEAVGERLARLGWTLATAESCTGGWISEVMTATAGSSAWFDRGFVTYSNAAKQDMLGVSAETLNRVGAVSEEVVREMVAGALGASDADIALAVSGIAGPGGGTADKPVGTVCFAWKIRARVPISETRLFAGDREAVRRQAVCHALEAVLQHLPAD
jgi:nicotinamide-nucleotide amidase